MEKSFTLSNRDFMTEKYAFVMMIKDKWWREFLRLRQKGKHVQSYVQNGWAPPKNTSLLFFYVSKPVGEIAGHAEFVERKTGDVKNLWEQHGSESVLQTREKYEEFTRDMQRVSFIRFKNLQEAAKPIPLNNILMFLGVKKLARGGFYVDKETTEKLIALME